MRRRRRRSPAPTQEPPLRSYRTDIAHTLRAYRPAADRACVVDGWIHSYRQSDWADSMHRRTYNATQRRLVYALLERARTIVACAPNDEETIYGWVCGELQPSRVVLHYVYVKHLFRGRRLGAALVHAMLKGSEPRPVVVSHFTHHAARAALQAENKHEPFEQLSCKYRPYVRYNPVLTTIPDAEVAL